MSRYRAAAVERLKRAQFGVDGRQPVSGAGALDRRCERPMYQQLADLFRERIVAGVVRPGGTLPSEQEVAREFEVGREVVRQAVGVLRAEGLVDTSRGRATRVRVVVQRASVHFGRGDRATARMPSDHERHGHGIAEGVPVVDIRRADGTVEVHLGDRIELLGRSSEPAGTYRGLS